MKLYESISKYVNNKTTLRESDLVDPVLYSIDMLSKTEPKTEFDRLCIQYKDKFDEMCEYNTIAQDVYPGFDEENAEKNLSPEDYKIYRENRDKYKEKRLELREIADAIDAIPDEEIGDTAMEYYKRKKGITDSEEITEAPNLKNAKVNELIKQALGSKENAVKLAPKLEKYGIKVQQGDTKDSNGIPYTVYLVGKNGRKLKPGYWGRYDAYDIEPSREAYNGEDTIYNSRKDTYEHPVDHSLDNTLGAKSYKRSKEGIALAKQELPTLKKRLNLYERRYGKDSKEYRELSRWIERDKERLNKGIQPERDSRTLSPDIDYKNYLDSTFISDRPKPGDEIEANAAPWYSTPHKVNSQVAKYLKAKEGLERVADEKTENLKKDEKARKEVEYYQKQADKEKAERDKYTAKHEKLVNKELDEVRARIAKLKKKFGKEDK